MIDSNRILDVITAGIAGKAGDETAGHPAHDANDWQYSEVNKQKTVALAYITLVPHAT